MVDTAALRREYTLAGLSENDLDADPTKQFGRWFDEALAANVLEPNAMVLSTADANGTPSSRVVLLKGFDARGFVFFTNYESKKGRDLAENPRASLCFPWIALERQVVVEGDVTRVSREETEAYFASRPRGSRIGAWASKQSAIVPNREALEAEMAAVEARFDGVEIPAPPHWGGFRLAPRTIEFWQGRPSRMHDRLRYRRDRDAWIVERLSP